jgi:acetyl esterase/lipase
MTTRRVLAAGAVIGTIACAGWPAVVAIARGQSRSALDLANVAVAPGGQRVAYGGEPLQFGELRLPAGKGPHPVAIVIHGGCWLSQVGMLDPRAVSYENMRPLAAGLNASGIATWNIEYRRVGHPGGGWPGTFRDVGRAADMLRTLAKEHPLDLGQVITIGHSAGGHFATWVAARPRLAPSSAVYLENPIRVNGVVSLDGPADLKATISIQQSICGKPVITDLMGGTPEQQPARFHDGSPIELLPIGVRQVFFTGRMFDGHAGPYQRAATRAPGISSNRRSIPAQITSPSSTRSPRSGRTFSRARRPCWADELKLSLRRGTACRIRACERAHSGRSWRR